MYAFRNEALPQGVLPGIHHTTLACAGNGTKNLSVWRQSMDAGQATPPHRHACEEVVTVLSGTGRLLVGDEVIEFGPDSTLVLPAGVDHQIINSGDMPLVTVAVFAMTPVMTMGTDGEEMPLPWVS